MIAGIIGGALRLLGFLIGGLLSLACFAFWLWMLIDAITNKRVSDGEKIAWVLVIIFLPLLGSIIYFFVGRSKGFAT
jgi:hypothetical protein